jgi:uncharacterized RDD family membrane protein YckC
VSARQRHIQTIEIVQMIKQSMVNTRPPAGLLRRLGAIISDALVVVGLLLLATLLFVPLLSHLGAKAMTPSEVGWFWAAVYWLWLLCIWMLFFCFFWSRSGQTVGMRAWHLRVENDSGALLTWTQSLMRFWMGVLPWLPCLLALSVAEQFASDTFKYVGQGLSLLGIAGLLVMYLDPSRRTWQDRITHSHVVLLPKP